MTAHRITWVLVETDDVPTTLPARIALAVTDLHHSKADQAICAACPAGVGYVLATVETARGDEYERLTWRTVAVLDDGERTWLLCEDCTLPLSPALART